MTARATQDTAIAAALDKCADAVDATAPGRWRFTLSNGTALAAQARVDDGWLLLDAARGGGMVSLPRAWELLGWNATLEGGARFAIRRDLRLCAELPLDDEVDLSRRIVEACAGLKAANERFVCGPNAAKDVLAGGDADGNLAGLCRESGWPFVERDGGRLVVELDVPGAFQQATIVPRGDGAAVTVPVLETGGPAAPSGGEALGLLLLRVCGIVRMARAAVETTLGPAQARFEVVFGSRPCAAELTHAFAALSVACRVAGREAAVLWTDEGIARAYIDQWEARKEDHDGGSNDDSGASGE